MGIKDACQVSRPIPDLNKPPPSAEDQAALNEFQGMAEMSRQPQTYEKSEVIDTTRREKNNRVL